MIVSSSRLQQKLEGEQFVVTTEVCPPKGADCSAFVSMARELAPFVDAINVTDNQGAHMRISPLAAAALLQREGIEPVFQLTCRDRNRLALQSDLLGAAALGVKNILLLTGDHISFGDHKEAKAVFDLDSVQLIDAASRLCRGEDLSGKKLHGAPSFYIGAAAAPEAEPFELTLFKLRKKISAGARFLQTQAVFAPLACQKFHQAVAPLGTRIIAGIIILKSAGMARFINANIPGLKIPETIIAELENSANPHATGIDIACRLAKEVKPYCHGIHIMPMGQEQGVSAIVASVSAER
ncbi:MAG TPA: methylenetetrahydrofolate reductase [Geobacteraceae bacterium]|nr:methylenetetrahydrofolate reductase [Geobacteraceae bacterium]